MNASISLEDPGHVAVRFSGFGFPEALRAIKAIPSRRFVGKENGDKRWLVSINRLPDVRRAFPSAWLDKPLAALLAQAPRLAELRRAKDGPHPPEVLAELRPYQRAGIAFLRELDCCGLFDTAGSGKTRTAISWALVKKLAPVLVVSPSCGKFIYRDEILKCEPSAKVAVLEGRGTSIPTGADFVVLNFDILAPRVEAIKKHGFKGVIVSEAHYAKGGRDTVRGQAILDIAKHIPCRLAETGSPMS